MTKPKHAHKTATITVYVDESCEMARVAGSVYPLPANMESYDFMEEGNYWDFHPGCYGNHTFGDYVGPDDLADKMEMFLEGMGYVVKRARKKYKYDR